MVCASLLAVKAPLVSARANSPVPDLDAIVTYESRQVLRSGVTRTEIWKERLIRRADTVWTERILPQDAPDSSGSQSEKSRTIKPKSHKHFDYETAARWLSRNARGDIELRFVDTEHQVVVSVPKTEFATVGFDGRWDAAAHVVPPSVIRQMPQGSLIDQRAQQPVWVREKKAGWSHQVMWSDARQIALQVQSHSLDGAVSRAVSVAPTRASPSLPWLKVQAFEQKTFEDFLD